jgi:glutamate-1-semialdehyde 2,1-aminomutase
LGRRQISWGLSPRQPCFPASSGLPPGLDQNLIVVPYNRADILEQVFEQHGSQVAALICEPVYYNAGCVLPTTEFLTAMVRLPRAAGALLIFDEVLSAFRMGPGGAQEFLGVTPDLCTLGKAVGGSLPLSVFGGRHDVMAALMPEGTCQHSGTYNAHPIAVGAGLAAVTAYCRPGFYEHIYAVADRIYGGLQQIFDQHSVAARVQGLGARFGIYFGMQHEVRSYRDAVRHDRSRMLQFVAAAIREGVYFHDYGGAACHHGFCAAMTLSDADKVLNRLDSAVSSIRGTFPCP